MEVSAIYIYPIKSLGGIAIPNARLTKHGLANDRRFMLTTPEGVFMTQRTNKQMALLKTSIRGNRLSVWDSSQVASKIDLPLQPQHFIKQQTVTIWKDTCLGQVMDKRINRWFSQRLNQPCQLVYMPNNSQRLINEKHRKKADEVVSFADGYPILLFGQAGMDVLNKKLETPVSIDRFRANVIFTGGQPFEEDNWQVFKIGNQSFRGIKPCVRCNVPNINQSTATIEKEPNRTLATFRRFNKKIYVGLNACWEGNGTEGMIKVGDTIIRNE